MTRVLDQCALQGHTVLADYPFSGENYPFDAAQSCSASLPTILAS